MRYREFDMHECMLGLPHSLVVRLLTGVGALGVDLGDITTPHFE